MSNTDLNERLEFIRRAERLKDKKGNPFHPDQKPEALIQHFMEISSNRGDTVFDGFMGTGTVGAVAVRLGRKFIGIENNETLFEAARRRIEYE